MKKLVQLDKWISAKAGTTIFCTKGSTPLQYAQENRHTKVVELLLRHQQARSDNVAFLQQVATYPAYQNLMAQIDIMENQKHSLWQDLTKNEATQKALREIQQKIIAQNDSVEDIIGFIKERKLIIDQPTGIAPTILSG